MCECCFIVSNLILRVFFLLRFPFSLACYLCLDSAYGEVIRLRVHSVNLFFVGHLDIQDVTVFVYLFIFCFWGICSIGQKKDNS